MKAVALQAVGRMELVDIPEPEPGPGDLKLRVRYCGVCGSDLHEYRSSFLTMASNRKTPVMGHEFSASVVGLGSDVQGFAVGDLVVVNPNEPCGECRACLAGQDQLCGPVLGVGYSRVGGFAEYVCAQAKRSIRMAPDAPADRLATTEPLAVAVHALNRCQLQRGETVFIAGAGPIGAFTILAARHKGAGQIIVSEPAANRRELALRLGADEVIDPTATPPSLRVLELVPGGVDVSVECVGINPPLDDCILTTRRGGRIVVAGVFEMPSQILLLRTMVYEHTIIGAFAYTLAEFTEVAHLIASGAIDVSPVISRTVSLADLPQAFADLDADRNSFHKVLVSPDV
jgi:(R,R)-butanediol dehydrogenase/meso-butanediol dehydrogenase/diacetyl reductase